MMASKWAHKWHWWKYVSLVAPFLVSVPVRGKGKR